MNGREGREARTEVPKTDNEEVMARDEQRADRRRRSVGAGKAEMSEMMRGSGEKERAESQQTLTYQRQSPESDITDPLLSPLRFDLSETNAESAPWRSFRLVPSNASFLEFADGRREAPCCVREPAEGRLRAAAQGGEGFNASVGSETRKTQISDSTKSQSFERISGTPVGAQRSAPGNWPNYKQCCETRRGDVVAPAAVVCRCRHGRRSSRLRRDDGSGSTFHAGACSAQSLPLEMT
ncbi:unnamed protein product [Lampetra planeri]